MSFAFVIFWVMVVTSVGLSIASGYETLLGLVLFMPDGFIGLVIGFIFTLSIQALLLAISWRIANHLLDPLPRQIPQWTGWAICAVFSAYFSYFGFFQATGGRDENVRVDKVVAAQSAILQQIRSAIETDMSALSEQYISGDDGNGTDLFNDWSGGLKELIETASVSKADIQRNARAREKDLSDERAELQRTLDVLRDDVAEAIAEVSRAGTRGEDLRAEIETLGSSVDQLTAEEVKQEGVVKGLEEKLEIEGRTGQGRRYRDVEIDLGTARSELQSLNTQLETVSARLEERREAKVAEDIKAEQQVEANRVNEIQAEISSAEARIAAISGEIEEAREASRIDFSHEEREYNSRRDRLNNEDYTAYQELVGSCERIKRQMSEVGLADKVSDTECVSLELGKKVSELAAKQVGLNEFSETCEAGRIVPDRSQEATSIDPLLTQLRGDCIDFAPDPQVRAEIGRGVSDLVTRRGDEAGEFARAGTALLKDWQPNAIIAAVLAVIIDILVLLCALIGRNLGLPESVRAIDAIIANLRSPEPGEGAFERRYELPEDGNARALVQPVITSLLSDELAVRADTAPDEPQVLLLRPGTLLHLKKMRSIEMRGAAAEAAEATIPSRSKPKTGRGRF